MNRSVLARIGYALVYLQLVFHSYEVTPRTGFIPLDEPAFMRGVVAVIGFPGLIKGSFAWLLVLASAMPLTIGLSYGRLDSLLLFIASILVAWMNMIPWGLRARSTSIAGGGRTITASIGVYAVTLTATIGISIAAFRAATGFISAYFAGLPGDVGLFYSMLTSTRLWTLVLFAAVGFAVFKALENTVLISTSLTRGGRHLVVHDATSEAKAYARHLALMEGVQYPILSESFAIILSLALYPPLYSILRGVFDQLGAAFEGADLLLPLILYLPLWLVVRGFTRSLVEPLDIKGVMNPRRGMAWVALTIIFTTLILLISYIAELSIVDLLKTATTGSPSYSGDPLASIYNDEVLGESITALITAIDELGRLIIDLFWGG